MRNQELQDAEDGTDYGPYGAPSIAGNHRDDDAFVIDDLLQANPNPGLPSPMAPGEPYGVAPSAPTRAFTGSVTLTNNGQPQKLFSHDPNRLDLHIFIVPLDALVCPVTLASDNASLISPSVSTVVYAASSPSFRLSHHTGPLYAVLPESSVSPAVIVSWIATTK